MTADWWIISALGVACVVFAIWHARVERLRAIERCEAALRGERKMHMEMEQNLLKLRNDALADLRNVKAEMADMLFQHKVDIGEYQRENAELRRRLGRPKGRDHWRSRKAIIQGEESP